MIDKTQINIMFWMSWKYFECEIQTNIATLQKLYLYKKITICTFLDEIILISHLRLRHKVRVYMQSNGIKKYTHWLFRDS